MTMFVTFYSYKGGVGRTLALVNAAYHLAEQGRRVLLIDFDLEAPGLHRYKLTAISEIKKGVVDYILDYIKTGEYPPLRAHSKEKENRYIYSGNKKPYSNILLMPAGNPYKKYGDKVKEIDFNFLYNELYGYEFFEQLKEQIRDHIKPDYVFIDARTGLTDISKICLSQLPDIVALLFGLNTQNYEGIRKVYSAIQQAKTVFKREEDIRILPVVSPAPLGEVRKKKERKDAFRKIFGQKTEMLTVSYHPWVFFEEIITLKSNSLKEEQVSDDYRKLANTIKALNPHDPEKRVKDFVQKGITSGMEGKHEEAIKYFDQALKIDPNHSTAYFYRALSYGKLSDHEKSIADYTKAIELDPKIVAAYNNRGNSYAALEKHKLAIQDYDRAIELDPKGADVYNNRGNRYAALGERKRAFRDYDKAIELAPKDAVTYLNRAEAFICLNDYKAAIKELKSIRSDSKLDLSQKDKIYLSLLETVASIASGKSVAQSSSTFEKLIKSLKDKPKITWGTDVLRTWLSKAKLSQSRKTAIRKILTTIDRLRTGKVKE